MSFVPSLDKADIASILLQCMSRMARKLGLAPLANTNDLIFSFISCMCSIPLLPACEIWAGVTQLWTEVELSGWSAELLPLFVYFENEWKPRLLELSVFGEPERTNNCSESDNRMLANVVPQNFPNIWILIGEKFYYEVVSVHLMCWLQFVLWILRWFRETGVSCLVRHYCH